MDKPKTISILIFFWSAILLIGCNPEVPIVSSLENTLWQAEKVILPDGTTIAFNPWRTATIFFANGEAGGRTPCNFFGASYMIEEEALELNSPQITNAACANDTLEVQERVFIDKLFTAEIFSITGDELTLIYPGGSFVFIAKTETKGNESAVYTGVLREWQEGDKTQFALVNDTAFNAPGISLDETLAAVQVQLTSLSQNGVEIDSSTLRDFQEKNETTSPLEGVFPASAPIQFISEEYLSGLFAGGETKGWDTFEAQYIDAAGIFTLSRVGFNTSGEQALVHIGRMTRDDTGNFSHLLSYNYGIWVNNAVFRLDNP